jgi:hypothetical protein
MADTNVYTGDDLPDKIVKRTDIIGYMLKRMQAGKPARNHGYYTNGRVLYYGGNRLLEHIKEGDNAVWLLSAYNEDVNKLIRERWTDLAYFGYDKAPEMKISNLIITAVAGNEEAGIQEHFDQTIRCYEFLTRFNSRSKPSIEEKLRILYSITYLWRHRVLFNLNADKKQEEIIKEGKFIINELGDIRWKI